MIKSNKKRKASIETKPLRKIAHPWTPPVNFSSSQPPPLFWLHKTAKVYPSADHSYCLPRIISGDEGNIEMSKEDVDVKLEHNLNDVRIEILWKCTECNFESSDEYLIQQHEISHANWKDHTLGKSDPNENRHMTWMSKSKPLGKNSKKRRKSSRQLMTNQKNDLRYLGVSFIRKGRSNNHQRLSANQKENQTKPYGCPRCPHESTSALSLSQHLKVIHRALSCEMCNFTTFHMRELIRHETAYHTGDSSINLLIPRSYGKLLKTTPEEKSLRFKNKHVRLKTHRNLRSENTARGYKCSSCLYITENKEFFKRHLKKHKLQDIQINQCDIDITKEKIFQCKICSFKTQFRHYLNLHLKRHDTELDSGNESSEKILIKEVRKKYKNNVKLSKSYRCGQCKFRTNYKKYLEIHMTKHRPVDNLETGDGGSVDNQRLDELEESFESKKDIQGTHRPKFYSNTPQNLEPSAAEPKEVSFFGSIGAIKNIQEHNSCTLERRSKNLKPSNFLTMQIDFVGNQTPLATEESNNSKENSQNIELSTLQSDPTKNLESVARELSDIDHTNQCKSASDFNFITKYKKYLDKVDHIEISEIDDSMIKPEPIEEVPEEKRETLNAEMNLTPKESFECKETDCKVLNVSSADVKIYVGESSNSGFENQIQETTEQKSSFKMLKCEFCKCVTRSRQYFNRHIEKHMKSVKKTLRKKKCIERVTREPPDDSIDTTKTYTGFKCHKRNCSFITNVKEYLDLHLEKHISVKIETNDLLSKLIPKPTGHQVHQALNGFKCNHCDFITNSKEYMETHIEVHQSSLKKIFSEPKNSGKQGFGMFQAENVKSSYDTTILKNVDSGDSAENVAVKVNADIKSNDVRFKHFENDIASSREEHFEVDNGKHFKCNICNFDTNFPKYFELHMKKHTNLPEAPTYELVHYSNNAGETIISTEEPCDDAADPAEYLYIQIHSDSQTEEKGVCDDHSIDNITSNQGSKRQRNLADKRQIDLKCKTNFQENLDLHYQRHLSEPEESCDYIENFDGEPSDLFPQSKVDLQKNPLIDTETCQQKKNELKQYNSLEEVNESDQSSKETSKIYQCTHCKFKTKFEEYMTLHINKHTLTMKISPNDISSDIRYFDRAYKCKQCDFSTHFTKFFEAHVEKHIPKIQTDVSISDCPLSTDIDKKDKVYKCKTCGFLTNLFRFFEAHLEKHTSDNTNTPLINVKAFSNVMDNSSDHSNDRSQDTLGDKIEVDRPYKCEKCNFSTHFIKFLRVHLEKHTEEGCCGKLENDTFLQNDTASLHEGTDESADDTSCNINKLSVSYEVEKCKLNSSRNFDLEEHTTPLKQDNEPDEVPRSCVVLSRKPFKCNVWRNIEKYKIV